VSFRGRLVLFFVLIVVVPMVVAAVLVNDVTADSENGKADARLSAGLETATTSYDDAAEAATGTAREIAADPQLGEALRSGDRQAVDARLRALAAKSDVEGLILEGGDTTIILGENPLIAPGTVALQGSSGGSVGSLRVAVTTPDAYVEEVARLTGSEVTLLSRSEELAATAQDAAATELPTGDSATDAELDGAPARAAAAELAGGQDLRVALFSPVEDAGFVASSPLVFAALGVFFAVALLLVLIVVRSLQGQVGRMLDAARRIGRGDFSQKLPVSGRDELAGLADEFNKMSDQLSDQMDELRSQRVEIERSVQRIGEAFASGLDRQALLEIIAETALSACSAEYGLIALGGREGAEAAAGKPTDALQEAVLAAEDRADREMEMVAVEDSGSHALAAPLRRIADPSAAVGAMTVARQGDAFGEAERDVFLYLVGQAQASIENVALHELVSEQAVTDELTSLANKRALGEFLEKEAARARRFRHDLSLLMLDIDDFKQVNDRYGHPQGDQVLRAVGRILRAESRGVDEPARYGGEEFAVALPETGAGGALELAERIRVQLEQETIPFLERDGTLKVTASIGVASIPSSARDIGSLIAAADAALYTAKRQGKNRVEQAPGLGNGQASARPEPPREEDSAGEPGQASKTGD
jgi:diguanylate cyclase (GGDEF)-like protein